jgi:hypothetical protein
MKKQIGYKELREIGADKAEKAIRILRSNMDNPTPDKYYNVLNILSKIDKHIKSIQIPNGNFQKLNFKGDNLCDVIWKVFKYIHLGIKEDENGTT